MHLVRFEVQYHAKSKETYDHSTRSAGDSQFTETTQNFTVATFCMGNNLVIRSEKTVANAIRMTLKKNEMYAASI